MTPTTSAITGDLFASPAPTTETSMSTTPTSPSGRDFAATFEATYDSRHGLRQGGTTDRTRDRLVHEERIKLQRQGYPFATVINLNAFPLTVYLGDMGVVSVPAAP